MEAVRVKLIEKCPSFITFDLMLLETWTTASQRHVKKMPSIKKLLNANHVLTTSSIGGVVGLYLGYEIHL